MKLFRIFALCVSMVLSVAGLAFASVTSVSPMDVYNYMEYDHIGYLIDIRTPEEWCGGDYWDPRQGKGWKNTDGHPVFEDRVLNISSHLFSDTGRYPNPWFQQEFLNRYDFVTDEPFVLMCASGKRSNHAAADLDALSSSLGLDWDIYNMVGGFEGRSGPDDYCIDEHCTGWKESWDGFSEGLPRIDPLGEHVDPWEYQDPYFCDDAYYVPAPIPGTLFLLGSGLIGIIGATRRKFMR